MKAECYTDNVLQSMILQSTEKIYEHLKISDMHVINVGGEKNQDPAG